MWDKKGITFAAPKEGNEKLIDLDLGKTDIREGLGNYF